MTVLGILVGIGVLILAALGIGIFTYLVFLAKGFSK